MIGSPRAYWPMNRCAVTWVSNFRNQILTFCNKPFPYQRFFSHARWTEIFRFASAAEGLWHERRNRERWSRAGHNRDMTGNGNRARKNSGAQGIFELLLPYPITGINKPCPSCFLPVSKRVLVYNLSYWNVVFLHVHCFANQAHFRMKGCAPGLSLKQR